MLVLLLVYALFQGKVALIAPALADQTHQLNVVGFASCLSAEENRFNLDEIADIYELGTGDLLLPYLAVSPGQRVPGLVGRIQSHAHARWATVWDGLGARLADYLAQSDEHRPLTPADVYRAALQACKSGDIFCAALVTHNVLRTLGRHQTAKSNGKDRNPEWFRSRQDFWLERIPRIAQSLIPLRNGPGGERYGEWYHFFGLLVYSIRELALHNSLSYTRFVAFMNRVLNPILTGTEESIEKAQLDKDAVVIAGLYLLHKVPNGSRAECDRPSAYAAVRNTLDPADRARITFP